MMADQRLSMTVDGDKYDCPKHPGDGDDWLRLGLHVFCPICLGLFLLTKMPTMEKRKERDA